MLPRTARSSNNETHSSTNITTMAGVPTKPKTLEEIIANVSSAKWKFGTKPSPWYDVDNLVPQPPNAIVPFHLFSSFPVDIVLYMVQFLPKESAIALALTNKGMLQLIGERVFDGLTDQERWRLVLLLERDSTLMMACHCCQKLHNAVLKGRETVSGWPSACKSGNSALLPLGITFVQCKVVLRQYLRQQPYTDFLTIPSGTKILSLPDFKVYHSSALRIVNGHLLFRSQTFVAPFPSSATSKIDAEKSDVKGDDRSRCTAREEYPQTAMDVSGHVAYLLHRLSVDGDMNLFSVHGCAHQSATSLGFCFPRHDYRRELDENTFFLQHPKTACQDAFRNERAFLTDHKASQNWCDGLFHLEECYGSTLVAPRVFQDALHPTMACALHHDQPCTCEAMLGSVHSCPECFTDRCVSAREVEGIGRVMTVTAWRDLGGLNQREGLAAWFSHFDQRDSSPYTEFGRIPRLRVEADAVREPRHTVAAAGSIFASYEGISKPPEPYELRKKRPGEMQARSKSQ